MHGPHVGDVHHHAEPLEIRVVELLRLLDDVERALDALERFVAAAGQWRLLGRRGGLGGYADRVRAWLARSLAPGLTGERRAVLEGIVLGEDEGLSPGQAEEIARVMTAYPEFDDTPFVRTNLERWLA